MAKETLESILIESNEDSSFTPSVKFDVKTGICTIEGESCLENAAEFYARLINWFEKFINQNKGAIQLNLKLMYFNTSSSKCILDMLKILKRYKDSGGKVTVNWYYRSYDADQLEEAQDYVAYTKLPMNIIPIQDD